VSNSFKDPELRHIKAAAISSLFSMLTVADVSVQVKNTYTRNQQQSLK